VVVVELLGADLGRRSTAYSQAACTPGGQVGDTASWWRQCCDGNPQIFLAVYAEGIYSSLGMAERPLALALRLTAWPLLSCPRTFGGVQAERVAQGLHICAVGA